MVTVEQWYGVPDQDMLSRKMNLQGVPPPELLGQALLPLSMTSNIALKMSDNSGQKGHGEIHVWDVYADNSHRVCTVLTWLDMNAEGRKSNKSVKLFGESMLYSACESGLHNEIHGLVDLNFVI